MRAPNLILKGREHKVKSLENDLELTPGSTDKLCLDKS